MGIGRKCGSGVTSLIPPVVEQGRPVTNKYQLQLGMKAWKGDDDRGGDEECDGSSQGGPLWKPVS